MNDTINTRSLGSDPSCDIQLDDDSVAGIHAHLELADNGLVMVSDSDSEHGVFLNRNDCWIRVKRITLCTGDRVSFGDVEVPLGRLISVFGSHSNARLEKQHVVLGHRRTPASLAARASEHGSALEKPRRNPVTGKIEEDRAAAFNDNHQQKVN